MQESLQIKMFSIILNYSKLFLLWIMFVYSVAQPVTYCRRVVPSFHNTVYNTDTHPHLHLPHNPTFVQAWWPLKGNDILSTLTANKTVHVVWLNPICPFAQCEQRLHMNILLFFFFAEELSPCSVHWIIKKIQQNNLYRAFLKNEGSGTSVYFCYATARWSGTLTDRLLSGEKDWNITAIRPAETAGIQLTIQRAQMSYTQRVQSLIMALY